jgi:hypothetical protein
MSQENPRLDDCAAGLTQPARREMLDIPAVAGFADQP